jgi:non-lysosomal glucosylceramidase
MLRAGACCSTEAVPLTVGGMTGVEQRASAGRLSPHKLTMQQYNDRVVVMAEKLEGDRVTLLRSYAPSQTDASSEGVRAWKAWAKTGEFPSTAAAARERASLLYRPGDHGGEEAASAVALRTQLQAGEARTIRFVVAWHAQELSAEGRTDNRTVCGTTDVNRMYHNRFAGKFGLEGLIDFATSEAVRTALRAGTLEWHRPVLASTMPGFLQFKLINSAYTMYTVRNNPRTCL